MTKIWDEKKRALKALDYFDFLDDDQIVEACRYGRLKQFDPLDTIFCEDIGSMTNVHFVLSGECLILQCLNIKTTPTIESHFIDVGTITFGGIFGLGEKMENRVIMARSTVQCLILPRFFLLEKKQNPGNVWERRLLYVGVMVPSREALFAHYRKACDWKKFKNDIISETLKPSDNDNTNIEDVPIICRIVESPEDLN
ncbi:uncharacterized protein LOC6606914 isoform X3 [Drosophila sechellia]|uniref:uncharacterized protein LOC6606914 isoform X3 n=1 Tax=Drosophila sechellia TaxID=7238 RepID=UPI0013DE064F|nr:uncharacterized protein LOC6606914 isoform X3 [Drosophila sechellia]